MILVDVKVFVDRLRDRTDCKQEDESWPHQHFQCVIATQPGRRKDSRFARLTRLEETNLFFSFTIFQAVAGGLLLWIAN